MQKSIISQLRSVSPEKRAEIINERYEKNRHFFRQYFPAVDDFLRETHCPYSINMTDSFLFITDEKTGEPAHPLPLDDYAKTMGGWKHEAWTDLFCLKVNATPEYPVHEKLVTGLFEKLASQFPQYIANYQSGRINLKSINGGKRRFSPPVIFLGIFHGLHIDYHYQCTDMPTALFVEPEPERFEVSLYFLDYEEIWQQENALYLSIGLQLNTEVFGSFFSTYRITPHLWCRILSGYVTPSLPYFVEQFRTLQLSRYSIFYPIDIVAVNLKNGLLNLEKQFPLLVKSVTAEQPYQIAIVASGPSLNQTIPWLKKNRGNLIIFAVHTAILVLDANGIEPDFQICLDTDFNEVMEQIGFKPDIPLILSYQASAEYLKLTNNPLFVVPDGIPQAACLHVPSLVDIAPSTTNLAFALACHCRPKAIYLLGCDFGFKNPQKHHASGTLYLDNEGNEGVSYEEKFDNIVIPANFPGPEPFYSTPFFVHTKQSVENAIMRDRYKTPVFNLSDGALVIGATAKKTSQVAFKRKGWSRKEAVNGIKNLFEPATEKVHWDYFPVDAEDALLALKEEILSTLQIAPFSWQKVSQKMDIVLSETFGRHSKIKGDGQLMAYERLFGDLLSHIYICLLFHDTREEAEHAYENSLEILQEITKQIPWITQFETKGGGIK